MTLKPIALIAAVLCTIEGVLRAIDVIRMFSTPSIHFSSPLVYALLPVQVLASLAVAAFLFLLVARQQKS